jgi:hypothetical protein
VAEHVVDAPSLAGSHDSACACWSCLETFDATIAAWNPASRIPSPIAELLEQARAAMAKAEERLGVPDHWRTAATEYHEDRTRRGGGPEVVPKRDNPGTHVAASTLSAAEYLVRQGNAHELDEWLARRPEAERRAIVAHLQRRRRA